MLVDSGSSRERASDQADGLRQLRRSDTGSAPVARVMTWPRLVLISESPSTDVGARFAFYLAQALGRHSDAHTNRPSLLVDLAPAASRLPQVLSDWIPSSEYPPLWSELAAGRSLATIALQGSLPLTIAAESQATPPAIDQLPRLYEQFVRQLGRQATRWRWIVLLALDGIVPLDRPCWQAADDIVLLSSSEATGDSRQAAFLRSRVADIDPLRGLWTLPKQNASWRANWCPSWSAGWLGRQQTAPVETLLEARWLQAGLATKRLPAVQWPRAAVRKELRQGTRADQRLEQSAVRIAAALSAAAGCQTMDAVAELAGCEKKIQLVPQLQPITQLSEVFRA